VQQCSANDKPLAQTSNANTLYNTPSGCDGGTSYACSKQSPYAVNATLSYGFAAAKLKNQGEYNVCCACYILTFQDGPVKNKRMVVQVTNIGYDLTDNHFDIAIPGGGQGIFKGCTRQYVNYYGGATYGGVSTIKECDKLPTNQKPGCLWRFNWFKNADNPKVVFRQVNCPSALINISGCKRTRK
jgi:hypothetical protein